MTEFKSCGNCSSGWIMVSGFAKRCSCWLRWWMQEQLKDRAGDSQEAERVS